MDTELFKLVGTMGTGGALAAFIFYFYQKATERAATDLKNIVERHAAEFKVLLDGQRTREEMLFVVVKENTVSNTRLIAVIDALDRRIGRAAA